MAQTAEMTREELEAWVANLENQNAALRKSSGRIKVSSKGGVSVYGLGRWPTSLYKSQWEKLLGMADEIRQFITDHEDELATKPSKE